MQNDSLDDRVSGAGPPALSLQSDADLTEVPDSFVHDESIEFGIHGLDSFRMGQRHVAEKDSWVFSLSSKWFKYKELELEDDLDFKSKHPSNRFRVHCLVHYSGSKRRFLNKSVNYARRSLYFICYSVDEPYDYELAPIASFHPKLSERDRFYQFIDSVAPVASFHPSLTEGARLYALQRSEDVDQNAHDHAVALDDAPFSLMQGVLDDDSIALSSPAQTGVLLSFAPPATSYACAAAS